MRAIEQRVAKLEQAAASTATLYAWQDEGETEEQAIARQWPQGAPDGARVVVCRWASDPTEADASQTAGRGGGC